MAIEYGEHGEYFIGLCRRKVRCAPKELVAQSGFQETPGKIDRIAMPIIGRERLKGERARFRSLLSIQTDLAWSVRRDDAYRAIEIEGRRIARDIVVKRRDLRSAPTRRVSLPGKQGGEWNNIGFELLPGARPGRAFEGGFSRDIKVAIVGMLMQPPKLDDGIARRDRFFREPTAPFFRSAENTVAHGAKRIGRGIVFGERTFRDSARNVWYSAVWTIGCSDSPIQVFSFSGLKKR